MQEEEEFDDDTEYEVEKILDKRIVDGEVEYLIKWDGWSIDDSTWEPVQNLNNIQNLIEDFEAEQVKKKKNQSKPTVNDINRISQTQNDFNKSTITEKINHRVPEYQISDENNVMIELGNNIPQEVISVKLDKNKKILCMVKFQERADGMFVENCYVPSLVLREAYPKVLIKFYESKIKFVNKSALDNKTIL